MIFTLTGVLARIISNSWLNVFQKVLTKKGAKSSVVNFYTYLGLTILGLIFLPFIEIDFSLSLLINFLCMGILGALGNYFIIKSLSIGELSSVAPINSYKPIVALVFAFIYLGEIPTLYALLGIILIIFGTYFLHKNVLYNGKAVLYRALALIFSAVEAVFIKEIIILTNISASFFLWAFSGLIFSSFCIFRHRLVMPSVKHLVCLVLSVGIMQYSTNFVFSRMNVSYALALFQLSTLLSVFLGANIFHEKDLRNKVIASLIMIVGAIIIILGGKI